MATKIIGRGKGKAVRAAVRSTRACNSANSDDLEFDRFFLYEASANLHHRGALEGGACFKGYLFQNHGSVNYT